MYFHKPMRSTTNSSKLTQALNSERPTTTLTNIGSCPNLNRSTDLPPGEICKQEPPRMQWECPARIERMLRLKVHFKSSYFDGRPLLVDRLLRAQRCAATLR